MKPLVSIIIPTHNRKTLVTDSINSCFVQGFNDIEVIVVDDGSTDGTSNYLRSLYKQPNLKILSIPKSGISKARNTGILRSSGKYIGFLDDDDFLYPNHVLSHLEIFNKFKDCKVCYSYADYMNTLTGTTKRLYDVPYNERYWATTNIIPSCTIMFNVECFNKYGMFNEKYSIFEDWDMWGRIALHEKWMNIPTSTVCVRKGHSSITTSVRKEVEQETKEELKKKFKLFLNRGRDIKPLPKEKTISYVLEEEVKVQIPEHIKKDLKLSIKPIKNSYIQEPTLTDNISIILPYKKNEDYMVSFIKHLRDTTKLSYEILLVTTKDKPIEKINTLLNNKDKVLILDEDIEKSNEIITLVLDYINNRYLIYIEPIVLLPSSWDTKLISSIKRHNCSTVVPKNNIKIYRGQYEAFKPENNVDSNTRLCAVNKDNVKVSYYDDSLICLNKDLLNNNSLESAIAVCDLYVYVDKQNNDILYKTKNYILKNNMNIPLSIIIPVYNSENYIEDCLNSIQNQSYFENNNNYEILLCVDNCKNSLNKIMEIKNNYKNIKIFKTDKNIGPYIIRNTLTEYSKYENYLFFDSDDIMDNNMILYIIKNYNENSVIRFGYGNFINNINKIESFTKIAHGVFFIPKKIFDKVGGFQNWKCGADTEFIYRCNNNKIQTILIDEYYLFYRRLHPNSLTNSKDTTFDTPIRNIAKNYILNNKDWSIPIKKEIYNIKEIINV